jgi:hypothetical protein
MLNLDSGLQIKEKIREVQKWVFGGELKKSKSLNVENN